MILFCTKVIHRCHPLAFPYQSLRIELSSLALRLILSNTQLPGKETLIQMNKVILNKVITDLKFET